MNCSVENPLGFAVYVPATNRPDKESRPVPGAGSAEDDVLSSEPSVKNEGEDADGGTGNGVFGQSLVPLLFSLFDLAISLFVGKISLFFPA